MNLEEPNKIRKMSKKSSVKIASNVIKALENWVLSFYYIMSWGFPYILWEALFFCFIAVCDIIINEIYM